MVLLARNARIAEIALPYMHGVTRRALVATPRAD